MPKYSGGFVKIHTADKGNCRKKPAQKHNLSFGCNRIVIAGPPNSGKSSLALQIIAASAPVAEVFVIHGTPGTTEYDLVRHTKLETPPTAEEWSALSARNGGRFCIAVVDDYQGCDATKTEQRDIRMLLRTISSHKNIQVIMTCHSLTNIPASWRRCFDVFCLFRPQDQASVPYLARQVGLATRTLRAIFAKLRKRGQHSFLMIEDHPPPGRERLRIDGEFPLLLHDDA